MFKTQLRIMVEKKSFKIGFTIMILLACLTPLNYVLEAVIHEDDISLLVSREYAYIFNAYSYLTLYTIFLIPILSFFTFSLSYVTDRKCGYDFIMISRKGSRSYYISKYFCCLIGGFCIVFIPALVNILINFLFLPSTQTDLFNDNVYNHLYGVLSNSDLDQNIKQYYIFEYNMIIEHPFLNNLCAALCMGVVSGVSSVSTFVASFFIKERYAFLSVLASYFILFFGRLYRTLYEYGIINTYKASMILDEYGTNEMGNKNYFVFFIEIIVLLIISFIIVIKKSDKDQL